MQGYKGCAVGKAKQAAKTELEKLKVRALSEKSVNGDLCCMYSNAQTKDMTCRELVNEVAKMYTHSFQYGVHCKLLSSLAVSIQCTMRSRTRPLSWS